MGDKVNKGWLADERRYYWSNVWDSLVLFSNNRVIPIKENNYGGDIFSEDRAYVEGHDKGTFNTWHIFTWKGNLNRGLKAELRRMYNEDKEGYYYDIKGGKIENWYHDEHSRQKLVMEFNKTYTLRRIRNGNEEGLTVEDNESSEETTLWISRIRGVSLQHQAASVVSRSIKNLCDVDKMVKQGIIPIRLSPMIKEYI